MQVNFLLCPCWLLSPCSAAGSWDYSALSVPGRTCCQPRTGLMCESCAGAALGCVQLRTHSLLQSPFREAVAKCWLSKVWFRKDTASLLRPLPPPFLLLNFYGQNQLWAQVGIFLQLLTWGGSEPGLKPAPYGTCFVISLQVVGTLFLIGFSTAHFLIMYHCRFCCVIC